MHLFCIKGTQAGSPGRKRNPKLEVNKKERALRMNQMPKRQERALVDSLTATIAKLKVDAETASKRYKTDKVRLEQRTKEWKAKVGAGRVSYVCMLW